MRTRAYVADCVWCGVVQLEVAIDTIANVDQAGYRPLHWLLFGKALLVGTGHVSHGSSVASLSHG